MKGRPTKCNDRITKIVCEGLRLGMLKRDALKRALLPRSTYCAWINRGKRGVQPYSDFWQRTEKAEADGTAYLIGLIVKAAKEQKSWQAAAWILERTRGYGRNQENKEEDPALIDSENVPVAELLEKINKSTEVLRPYLDPEISD